MRFLSIVSDSFSSFLQNAPWGKPVTPLGPSFSNPIEGISSVMVFGIRMVFIVGMVLVLVYLLWGALDYITGGGEQEKIEKARQKMTNAALGILIMVGALGLFTVVSGDVLGIIKRDGSGNWTISIPSIGNCIPQNASCNLSSTNCCTGFTCQANVPPTGTSGTCK
ncbi:hypothetical protein KBD81_02600 [Candidatus Woesebacteria bacterium]|nr:hypothetical protein [Candidatus Woesebacteria bacterium]